VTGVELECSYGAGDGRTRSGVASMPKERSSGPRLDRSCDWEKYGYDSGTLMAITWHVINRAGTGALMRCSSKETVEILMEAVAVSEKDDCHGIAEDVMFRQLAPMGTGGFNVALDINILKDAVVDHRLPVQNMLMAHTDGGMTPGQVEMMPYDTNSPAWSESNFKGKSMAFSAHSQRRDDPTNFSFLPHGQSPLGAGGMLPVSPGYSPSPPNANSPHRPMSHIVCGCSLTCYDHVQLRALSGYSGHIAALQLNSGCASLTPVTVTQIYLC